MNNTERLLVSKNSAIRELEMELNNRNLEIMKRLLWKCKVFSIMVPNNSLDPFEKVVKEFKENGVDALNIISEQVLLEVPFLESVNKKLEGKYTESNDAASYTTLIGIQDQVNGRILPYFFTKVEYVSLEFNNKSKVYNFYVDNKKLRGDVFENPNINFSIDKDSVLRNLKIWDKNYNYLEKEQIDIGNNTEDCFLYCVVFKNLGDASNIFVTNGIDSNVSDAFLASYLKEKKSTDRAFNLGKIQKNTYNDTWENHLDSLYNKIFDTDTNNDYIEECKKCYIEGIYEELESILLKAYMNQKIQENQYDNLKVLCKNPDLPDILYKTFKYDENHKFNYHSLLKNIENINNQSNMDTLLHLLMLGTLLNNDSQKDIYNLRKIIEKDSGFIEQLYELKSIRDGINHINDVDKETYFKLDVIKKRIKFVDDVSKVLIPKSGTISKKIYEFSEYSNYEIVLQIVNNLGFSFYGYDESLISLLIRLEKAFQDSKKYEIYNEIYKILTHLLVEYLSSENMREELEKLDLLLLGNLPKFLIRIRKSNIECIKRGNYKTTLGALFLGYLWVNKDAINTFEQNKKRLINYFESVITNRGHSNHQIKLDMDVCENSIKETYEFIKNIKKGK